MNLTKIRPHFGVDVDADIKSLGRDSLVSLILEYKIVRFKQQTMSATELEQVTALLGSIWYNDDSGIMAAEGRRNFNLPGSNIITLVNNKGRGVLDDIWVPWHSDVAHRPWHLAGGTMPARMLYGAEISPNETSSTSFYDKTYAYRKGTDAQRAVMDTLEIEFQADYATTWGSNRMPFTTTDPVTNEVIAHTQKLWVANYNSNPVFAEIYQLAQTEENVIENTWSPGDLIIANNYTTCHQRGKLVSTDERTLWRTTFQIAELVPDCIKPELL